MDFSDSIVDIINFKSQNFTEDNVSKEKQVKTLSKNLMHMYQRLQTTPSFKYNNKFWNCRPRIVASRTIAEEAEDAKDYMVGENVSKAEVDVISNDEADSTAGHMGIMPTLVVNVRHLRMGISPMHHLTIYKVETKWDAPEKMGR